MDGFRAVAILLVVWFHIWQQSWLSSNITVLGKTLYLDLFPRTGYLGVELLLFISGFGLFYSYRKKLLEKQNNSLKKYFARRARRIFPSYILSLLIIIIFLNPFFSFSETLYHLVTHIFFVHNLSIQTYDSINGVLWVLGVEVQFYLIFPFLSKVFSKFRFLTFLLMILTAIIYRQTIQNLHVDNLAYFVNQLPGFLDIYACGMLSAYILTSKKIISIDKKFIKIIATFLSLIIIAIFVQMLIMLDNTEYAPNHLSNWQANNRQYLGLIFGSLAISSYFSFNFWQSIFANRILIFISTISYNLFIWHQIIAVQLRSRQFPPFSGNDPHNDPIWQIEYTIVTVLLTFAVAILITYLFEKPIIKLGIIKYFQKNLNYLLVAFSKKGLVR